MAKKSAPQKRSYTQEGRTRVSTLKATFGDNLESIAEALANQEDSERVAVRHVADAFRALGRIGLRKRPWWKHHELQVSIGGALIGAAFGMPDIANFFWPGKETLSSGFTGGLVIASFVIGVSLVLFGWVRGRS